MPGEQLAEMRLDYGQRVFDLAGLGATWFDQLTGWMDEARVFGVVEPNAMVVATVDHSGSPSSRTVLAKGLDPEGIVFYTNLGSAKSTDLRGDPRVSVTFPWYGQHRQVHVRGRAHLLDRADTRCYWRSRPRGSQLGAWASQQSLPIDDRESLDAALDAVTRRFADDDEIPLPPHWGGWRVSPHSVEFWQGRSNRMHDRLRFEMNDADGSWTVRRLEP